MTLKEIMNLQRCLKVVNMGLLFPVTRWAMWLGLLKHMGTNKSV